MSRKGLEIVNSISFCWYFAPSREFRERKLIGRVIFDNLFLCKDVYLMFWSHYEVISSELCRLLLQASNATRNSIGWLLLVYITV